MRTLKGWWTSLLRVYFLFVGMISPPSPLFRFSRMNSSFGTMNLGTDTGWKKGRGKIVYQVHFVIVGFSPEDRGDKEFVKHFWVLVL